MEKAFDRIEWNFLTEVLRRFGFTDEFIDLVNACIRENHFSLLVNSTSIPLFTATRGLWQGDPLSPTLFILVEEVLSRTLSRAVTRGLIQPYHSKRGCLIISHSLFADDAILFLNGCEAFIKGLMTIISSYERATGQLVNASKSSFMVTSSATISIIRRIQNLTGFSHGFSRGHLPFDYLGCLIFLGRRRIHYFDALVGKLRKKLAGWKLQLLSPGGRIQLIRHVLMSMPLHLLAVHEVPDTVLQTIRRICTSFLWDGQLEGPRRQRRVSWEKACRPMDEGGLGIRRPQDVLNMLQKKLVWRMRTTPSVLGSFVSTKYGEWARLPADIKGVKRWADWQRHWLEMVPLIRWRVGRGAISAWYDTWLEDAPLASFTTFTSSWPRLTVAQLLQGDTRLLIERHGLPSDLLPAITITKTSFIEDQPI
ncbi:unnamed protein product [Spirodela intermedia]|uniref:Reverse transcriptase domain-containing protein n=1 Tax=Spirodela intermedia TaxID=51605 RepID=A0A7I8IC49_SPIIN|nr:unnamed protein product [Spirodela intermedia]CAA2617452.1 unnamed protein product [Spirodela intermedia]CAA6655168.1 unnamed protein product [Spirodela intermedia]CAA6657148.1 unnamed protein product [Spirodela intermedia]